MNTPLYIIVNMLINFALLVLFIRFMFGFAEIEASNPYAQAIKRMTGIVDTLSRAVPNVGAGRISLAAILLMLMLYWLNLAANAFILERPINEITLFFAGTLQAIIKFLSMMRYIIIGSVVASWAIMLFNANHPVIHIAMQLSEPIIAPFRRIMPNLGMIDLSSIAALFAFILAEDFIGIIGHNILSRM
ncbi:YggT family protein [Moraxella sp. ZY200743]|uniref:YggT family protein n=1 Tax=Moraxella sp. ZY200743 TaxID=2911970 RepID=UPI003D7DAB37